MASESPPRTGPLTMPNAVLVVDMLNGFCKAGNLASPLCDAAIPRVARILEERVAAGDHLVFLADNHAPDDREFEIFPPHCIRGTAEAEVVPELQRFLRLPQSTLVPKTRYSGFYGTDLDQRLNALAPQEVRVVGVCTDICVLHTVADLRNRDVRVIVPADGVETFDAPGHAAAEVNRFALDHMAQVLGAKVEPVPQAAR